MDVKKETKKMMEEVFQHFLKEMKHLRTGRANPGMLDEVQVEVYGTHMSIKSLGNVTVSEGRQLMISPFDPQTAGAIAKSIEKANLNLQAIVDGHTVRVPVPPLSEDVRKDIVKLGKKKAEEAKISIREVRRKANDMVKKKKSDGDFTEDQVKKMEKEVQTLTDDFCKQIDEKFAEREKEILSV
ncbi:MAG: ribosome recycling factor [Simkaniaceae bacterium]|nr:ribosome recycling factor [Simkaniaceae bacterium]MCF7852415.1 ribosome recycling factor [Simkaniaceae bacterium]